MSWISDNKMNWIQKMAAAFLMSGSIPLHVGIIMDGNRRFARRKRIPVTSGHQEGFKKLEDSLNWLSGLGVKEVTVYAFSIENFKREKQEVDNIMDILRGKLKEFLSSREDLNRKGLRLRVIGNLSLLPPDVCSLFLQAVEISKHNNKILLNIAVAYTAREEMTNAMNFIVNQLKTGKISEEDLNAKLLDNCLYTSDSPPVDIILRTSGEKRLSDFLLYQGSFSYLHFSYIFWPEFSPWSLLWAIFKYQRIFKTLKGSSEYRTL